MGIGGKLYQLTAHPAPVDVNDFSFKTNCSVLHGKFNRKIHLAPRFEASFIFHFHKHTVEAQVGHFTHLIEISENCRAVEFQSGILPSLMADFNMLAPDVDHFRFNKICFRQPLPIHSIRNASNRSQRLIFGQIQVGV